MTTRSIEKRNETIASGLRVRTAVKAGVSFVQKVDKASPKL